MRRVEAAVNATPSPHSIEAEQALLGQMLQSPDVIDEVDGTITAADFYRPDHGRLFALLCGARRGGRGTDLVAVSDAMMPTPDAFGGLAYVLNLPDRAPSTANAAYYVAIIAEHARRRRALAVLRDVEARLYERGDDVGAVLAAAVGALGDIGSASAAGIVGMDAALDAARERIRTSGQPGARFGVGAIDERIPDGIAPGSLIVVGARPATGKTALALQAARTASSIGYGALVCCAEMDDAEIAERHAVAQSSITYTQVAARRGLDWSEWEQVRDLATSDGPFLLDTRATQTVATIRASAMAAARVCARQHSKLAIVVVDYLQMLDHGAQRGELSSQAIGRTMYALKAIARDVGCGVVVLSQLNRDRDEHERPTLASLRDSGAIEAAAQKVLFLWYESQDARENRHLTVTIAKNRNGATGECRVHFDGAHQRFVDLSGEWVIS